jgi:hypothetical protein
LWRGLVLPFSSHSLDRSRSQPSTERPFRITYGVAVVVRFVARRRHTPGG